uniref:Polyols transporter 1 putative polyol transporter protein 1 n=1 Tax=Rhizophora mucronata TaxID=61149 RepID=A0A2P2KV52_RHIMU
MRIAPTKKMAPATTMVYRRPIQSDVLPAAAEPTREYKLIVPARISTCTSLILRSSLMNREAPLITPIS